MYARLKKKFGQNFLVDQNILRKLQNLITNEDNNILEIGAGSGNLTKFILEKKPKNLSIVEIDNDWFEILKLKFKDFDNLNILNYDILENINILEKNFELVISNLPYNISSQVLIKLSTTKFRPKKMILMFQKEFADRLLEKNLNSLNSIIQCFYSIKKKFEISNQSFFPPPKIKSTVVEFNLLNDFYISEDDITSFIEFKKNIFNKKRKTIGSILKNYKEINLPSSLSKSRAENLSLEEFVNIYNMINL